MKSLILIAAAVTAGASPGYHFDLARYLYASPGIEHAHRVALLAEVDGFLRQRVSGLDTPGALSRWLATYDSLSKRLNRHDLYVYLRAEEDTSDHADAAADEVLEAVMARMDATAERDLAQLSAGKLHRYIAADAPLARQRGRIANIYPPAAETSIEADLQRKNDARLRMAVQAHAATREVDAAAESEAARMATQL